MFYWLISTGFLSTKREREREREREERKGGEHEE